jgi:hypothetical protein
VHLTHTSQLGTFKSCRCLQLFSSWSPTTSSPQRTFLCSHIEHDDAERCVRTPLCHSGSPVTEASSLAHESHLCSRSPKAVVLNLLRPRHPKGLLRLRQRPKTPRKLRDITPWPGDLWVQWHITVCRSWSCLYADNAANLWRRKQIQFPERCVLVYLEFRPMDKVQKPSNPGCHTS